MLQNAVRNVKNIPFKNLIQKLNIALADIKAQTLSLQTENADLKKRIQLLEFTDANRPQVANKPEIYWIETETPPDGPLVPHCAA